MNSWTLDNAARAPQPRRMLRRKKCTPSCQHRGIPAAKTCGAAGKWWCWPLDLTTKTAAPTCRSLAARLQPGTTSPALKSGHSSTASSQPRGACLMLTELLLLNDCTAFSKLSFIALRDIKPTSKPGSATLPSTPLITSLPSLPRSGALLTTEASSSSLSANRVSCTASSILKILWASGAAEECNVRLRASVPSSFSSSPPPSSCIGEKTSSRGILKQQA
jgi:hypothetical protein